MEAGRRWPRSRDDEDSCEQGAEERGTE